ncbi:MAG: hypothetical protein L6N96_01890 [Candidatus Methylarchaceae archaeon HK02M2]|nr:hypothetical protein [Candidatus Methylarchaceae archaeon HK02M2]
MSKEVLPNEKDIPGAKKEIVEIVLEGEDLEMFRVLKEEMGMEDDAQAMKEMLSYLNPIRVEVEVPRNYYDCIRNEFTNPHRTSRTNEKLPEEVILSESWLSCQPT